MATLSSIPSAIASLTLMIRPSPNTLDRPLINQQNGIGRCRNFETEIWKKIWRVLLSNLWSGLNIIIAQYLELFAEEIQLYNFQVIKLKRPCFVDGAIFPATCNATLKKCFVVVAEGGVKWCNVIWASCLCQEIKAGGAPGSAVGHFILYNAVYYLLEIHTMQLRKKNSNRCAQDG